MSPKAKISPMPKQLNKLRVVIVGHVDHGKSTLIGRLLYDTKSLPDGKLAEIEAASKKRGDIVEWSYLLDTFQAERDQAITIDTTQIPFSTDLRDFIIIDAPGHTEFLKNMISGAAQADAAVLIVDADEGLQEQTKRHAYMLSLLGIRQVAVAINKMDKVNWDHLAFEKVASDISAYLSKLNIYPSSILPVSARHGDMISNRMDHMNWYEGHSLIDVLHGFECQKEPVARPLRLPIQDVYRLSEKRIIVGRIQSGLLNIGDTILVSPTNETAKVKSFETWPKNNEKLEVRAGETIALTLDKPIFIERGHMISHEKQAPQLTNVCKARLFWISQNKLRVGDTFKLRINTGEYAASIQSIEHVISTDNLEKNSVPSSVQRNEVAEVTLRVRDLIPMDSYTDNFKTGRFVLYNADQLCGGGTLSMDGYADQRKQHSPKAENITKVDHLLSRDKRAERNGYNGGIFWFTGLSGAGKSTLAMRVEQELFKKGYQTYVLDGDNIRHGLNKDLGFSPEDRTENIRRISEVAALIADSGTVCITAFISPYRTDREHARQIQPDLYHEIFIKASLDACEDRDPKGLYKKARKGQIKQFTGIDSPYEEPENPEITVDTENNDIDTCIEQIVSYIEENIRIKSSNEDDIERESLKTVSK